MSYVNENIKFLRNRMGLTQERFAEMIGINRKAVGSYEEGRATPPLEKLNKIAKLFGVTIDQLTSKDYGRSTPSLFADQEPEVEIHPEDLTLIPEKKKPFSRTGGQVPFFEAPAAGNIHYVSHKYFDKYILDTDFDSRLEKLPTLGLPFYAEEAYLRAFDVPVDSYCQEGIIIASKVNDFNTIDGAEYHLVVSNKKGFLLKRISKNAHGDFQIKSDTVGESTYYLKASEIVEIWKPVGFFSTSLPKFQADLSSLSSKINALKSDLDNLIS
jgi:transcriptional regulator with XRE-family HTH domain